MWRFTKGSMALLACLMVPAGAMAAGLALPASGIKAPYSPLAIPTRMTPLEDSLETLLDRQYRVVAAHQAGGEEVLVLFRGDMPDRAGSTVLCALTMPNSARDQNVVTSRCWALNHPDR
ncbi:hypothetical protein [Bombella apis]|uniref:hypothetical protein n=1 Tax=Bombella apis TaxID=1785988 RepID=UPI0023F54B98|nr:hypothetical protein [Bombella apis]MCT6813103.1 hypothetical protein [Bombella apis]MCT6820388.1 hypothetical protein [Bombella apis]MCT6846046.1 hypothetical protein [Bombella apis]